MRKQLRDMVVGDVFTASQFSSTYEVIGKDPVREEIFLKYENKHELRYFYGDNPALYKMLRATSDRYKKKKEVIEWV